MQNIGNKQVYFDNLSNFPNDYDNENAIVNYKNVNEVDDFEKIKSEKNPPFFSFKNEDPAKLAERLFNYINTKSGRFERASKIPNALSYSLERSALGNLEISVHFQYLNSNLDRSLSFNLETDLNLPPQNLLCKSVDSTTELSQRSDSSSVLLKTCVNHIKESNKGSSWLDKVKFISSLLLSFRTYSLALRYFFSYVLGDRHISLDLAAHYFNIPIDKKTSSHFTNFFESIENKLSNGDTIEEAVIKKFLSFQEEMLLSADKKLLGQYKYLLIQILEKQKCHLRAQEICYEALKHYPEKEFDILRKIVNISSKVKNHGLYPDANDKNISDAVSKAYSLPENLDYCDKLKMRLIEDVITKLENQNIEEAYDCFKKINLDAYSKVAYPHVTALYYKLKGFFTFFTGELDPNIFLSFLTDFNSGTRYSKEADDLLKKYYIE
jgi:hypothetical protein